MAGLGWAAALGPAPADEPVDAVGELFVGAFGDVLVDHGGVGGGVTEPGLDLLMVPSAWALIVPARCRRSWNRRSGPPADRRARSEAGCQLGGDPRQRDGLELEQDICTFNKLR